MYIYTYTYIPCDHERINHHQSMVKVTAVSAGRRGLFIHLWRSPVERAAKAVPAATDLGLEMTQRWGFNSD